MPTAAADSNKLSQSLQEAAVAKLSQLHPSPQLPSQPQQEDVIGGGVNQFQPITIIASGSGQFKCSKCPAEDMQTFKDAEARSGAIEKHCLSMHGTSKIIFR